MKLALMAEFLQMKLRSSHMEPKDQGRKGSGNGRCDSVGIRSSESVIGRWAFFPTSLYGLLTLLRSCFLFFVLAIHTDVVSWRAHSCRQGGFGGRDRRREPKNEGNVLDSLDL